MLSYRGREAHKNKAIEKIIKRKKINLSFT